jgi:hypothetical protein
MGDAPKAREAIADAVVKDGTRRQPGPPKGVRVNKINNTRGRREENWK